jgi:hypothetical protein
MGSNSKENALVTYLECPKLNTSDTLVLTKS